jgi:pyruvate/2-oxoglutarate dehydrogenase complex dihydrolipoamide dehydrogenase (E3) component
VVAANLLEGRSRRVSDRIPIHALYIDPPLAQAGMNEREVRKRGHARAFTAGQETVLNL